MAGCAVERLLDLVSDVVLRIVDAGLPVFICKRHPLGADDRNQDARSRQSSVDLGDEVSGRAHRIDVTEHAVLAKTIDESVVQASNPRLLVAAPVAKEYAARALRRLPVVRPVDLVRRHPCLLNGTARNAVERS